MALMLSTLPGAETPAAQTARSSGGCIRAAGKLRHATAAPYSGVPN
jgi:hypothetical protein